MKMAEKPYTTVEEFKKASLKSFESLPFEPNRLFEKYIEREELFYPKAGNKYNTPKAMSSTQIKIAPGITEIPKAIGGVSIDDINSGFSSVSGLLKLHNPEDKVEAEVDALFNQGTVLRVKEGVAVPSPMKIDISLSSSEPLFNKLVVFMEPESSAKLVVTYSSTDDLNQLYGENLDLYVSEGAKLDIVLVQGASTGKNLALNRNMIVSGNLNLTEAIFGGGFVRSRNLLKLSSEGAEASLNSAILGSGQQYFDSLTNLSHQEKGTISRVNMRAALSGSSRVLFKGVVSQEERAIKSSAYLSEHSLLLSRDARSNSIPSLEIKTDDVKASHSASSHPIEEDKAFYLMSRGIPRAEAIKLIAFGFLNQVLSGLSEETIPMRDIVDKKVAAA